jgi:sulfite reductase (NADPH) flavoprotein alpha-component
MKLFNKKREKNIKDIQIIYATKSGNSKYVANMTYKYLKKQGLDAEINNITDISPIQLTNFKNLLLVVSTIGHGSPPPSAKAFFNAINSRDMADLSNLNYSICALGDSSYEFFCEAGKEIDGRLQELNANQIHPRVDCDAEFSKPAIEWIKNTHTMIQKLKE